MSKIRTPNIRSGSGGAAPRPPPAARPPAAPAAGGLPAPAAGGVAPAAAGAAAPPPRFGVGRPAIEAAVALDGHEGEVAPDRDIALPARARHDRLQRRLRGVFDVVEHQSVEVALQRDPAVHAEGQIGIRVIKAARVRGIRIEHALRLAHRGHKLHVERRLAGVVLAGAEAFALVGHVAVHATTATAAAAAASGGVRWLVRSRLCGRDLLGRTRLRDRDLSHRGASASLLRRRGAGRWRRGRRILRKDRGHPQAHGSGDGKAKMRARVHDFSTGLPKSPYMRTISIR